VTAPARSCAFATYPGLPQLDPDDQLAADACARLGIAVVPAIWGDMSVDWSSTAACVVRSTWDYPRQIDAFAAWINRVERSTTLWNPPALLRWNLHKSYLGELEREGVPVIPTRILERETNVDLAALVRELGWPDAVVKPAYGAATYGVLRVEPTATSVAAAQSHVAALLTHVDVLVQPYFRSVTEYRERALVFIDGAFSHAASKDAFQGLLPAGHAGEVPVNATAQEIAVAARALAAVPGESLYARVDLVRDEADRPVVIEVELIEPSLFFAMHPPAADRFATALARRLPG
jgi:glutathione synthase/RimK-type ligase-like ATP-grasp enzyme